MALIELSCRVCQEESFDCCSGGSTTELFNGLKITNTSTSAVTMIHRPFRTLYNTTEVHLSDALGKRVTIALSDTVYSDIAELLLFVSRCQCSSTGIVIKATGINSNQDALDPPNNLSVGDYYIAGSANIEGHLEGAVVKVL